MRNNKILKITLSDDSGNEITYKIERSDFDEKRNLNDFILEALSVSEDKRKLPFIIQCPNGLEVEPKLKMKFHNYGSPFCGDDIESMVVTWQH